ncbi:MAG: hypothetical protein J5J00_09205 [Deltaproteobacteria bacterium]|nr:hypothetical protein [Deltaproteobacteria bacterium]
MKVRALLPAFLILLGALAEANTAAACWINDMQVTPKGESVVVRRGPAVNHTAVATLYANSKLYVQLYSSERLPKEDRNSTRRWIPVQLSADELGYVKSEEVQLIVVIPDVKQRLRRLRERQKEHEAFYSQPSPWKMADFSGVPYFRESEWEK